MVECEIVGPCGRVFRTISEAGEWHLETYYSDRFKERTHFFPQLFESGLEFPRYPASGGLQVLPKQRTIDDVDRGEQAELEFVRETISGGCLPPGCFVIRGFHFYANTRKIVDAAQPDFFSPNPSLADIETECDFLLLSPRLGLVIVEVKASNSMNQSKNHFEKACKPGGIFPKMEALLSVIKYHIGHSIPTKKVVAFPFLAEQRAVMRKRIFREDVLVVAMFNLKSWCNEIVQETEPVPTKVLDDLLSYLIAFSISSLSNQKRIIIDRTSMNLVSLVNAVKACSERLDQQQFMKHNDKEDMTEYFETKLGSQIMLLTPEQHAALNGPKHQIICGLAGTGKTLILQLKIQELVQNQKASVLAIVPATLVAYYEHFMTAHQLPHSNVWGADSRPGVCVISMQELFDNVEQYMPLLRENAFHVIVDEAPLFLPCAYETALQIKGDADHLQWFAEDFVQMPFQELKYLQFYAFQAALFQIYYHRVYLTSTLRGTVDVIDGWIGDLAWDSNTITSAGTMLNMGHNVRSRPIISTWLHKDDAVPYADAAGTLIANELGVYVRTGVSLTHIAVLVNDIIHVSDLRQKLQSVGFQTCGICESLETIDKMVCDYVNNSFSWEWPVVFYVDASCVEDHTLATLEGYVQRQITPNSEAYLGKSRAKVLLHEICFEIPRFCKHRPVLSKSLTLLIDSTLNRLRPQVKENFDKFEWLAIQYAESGEPIESEETVSLLHGFAQTFQKGHLRQVVCQILSDLGSNFMDLLEVWNSPNSNEILNAFSEKQDRTMLDCYLFLPALATAIHDTYWQGFSEVPSARCAYDAILKQHFDIYWEAAVARTVPISLLQKNGQTSAVTQTADTSDDASSEGSDNDLSEYMKNDWLTAANESHGLIRYNLFLNKDAQKQIEEERADPSAERAVMRTKLLQCLHTFNEYSMSTSKLNIFTDKLSRIEVMIEKMYKAIVDENRYHLEVVDADDFISNLKLGAAEYCALEMPRDLRMCVLQDLLYDSINLVLSSACSIIELIPY